MKTVNADIIRKTAAELCVKANTQLRPDCLAALKDAARTERNNKSRNALLQIIENARIARQEGLAICQDTGLPVVFLEIGCGVRITGDLRLAVLKGVEEGYKKGNFRSSIVRDPLLRGKPFYQSAVMHTDLVKGAKLKITVLPKGFGCENKSQLKMFLPTAGVEEISRFVVEAVKSAGPDACPPYIVGVGIGGTADYASLLAKKALLNKLNAKRSTLNANLEKKLLREINNLNIGPMGLGGKSTCLSVNIETHPTHIAGLPVAVNISCHALRSASATL